MTTIALSPAFPSQFTCLWYGVPAVWPVWLLAVHSCGIPKLLGILLHFFLISVDTVRPIECVITDEGPPVWWECVYWVSSGVGKELTRAAVKGLTFEERSDLS